MLKLILSYTYTLIKMIPGLICQSSFKIIIYILITIYNSSRVRLEYIIFRCRNDEV